MFLDTSCIKKPKIQIVIDTVSLKENVFRLFGLGFFLQIYFLDWYTSYDVSFLLILKNAHGRALLLCYHAIQQ